MPLKRWRWFWPYLRRRRLALATVITLAILASLLSISLPYLTKLIVDEGLIGRDFPRLVHLCAAVVGLAAASFAVGGLNRWLYVHTSGSILFALREDIYAHLLTLPPAYFRRRAIGDLVTRLDGDVAEIQRFGTDTVLAVVNGTLTLTATSVIMMLMCWPLALVAAAMLPLQLALRKGVRPWITARTRDVREQASAIAHFLYETLSSAKAIQGMTAESHEQVRLVDLNRGYLRRLVSQQLLNYSIGGISSLLSHIATAAVFIYGGYRVIHGTTSVGTLVAFVAYMTRSTGSAISLLNLVTAYQRANVSLDRVAELRAFEPAPLARRAMIPVPTGHGELRLEDVELGRACCGRQLLGGCTLTIAAGSKIVLYGESGVGKSTLTDALRRFVPLDRGRIMLDGRDIETIEPGTLRRTIEVLVTEPTIFRATVFDNLRYGSFDAPEAEVLRAARLAGVDDFVGEMPGGYATLLGHSGQGLSTGQRQRIAIARALLRDARVVILDEAMANLDSAAARALHQLIDEHFAGRTRIVISHAPTRVPGADAFYELHGGHLDRRDLCALHV